MSELFKTLSNIRSLRVALREVSLEQAQSLLEKLSDVIAEKKEEIKQQQEEEAKRLESLKKYKEMLAQDGITAEELALLLAGTTEMKKREPRAPRPAKYKFVDENGLEKTWTGQGRTPLALQKALNAGKSLSDFEI